MLRKGVLSQPPAIRHSEHGFTKEKFYLTHLVSFYNKVTHLVDEEKMVDVVFLDFTKTFDTVPHRILLDKLSNCCMSGFMVHWMIKPAWTL